MDCGSTTTTVSAIVVACGALLMGALTLYLWFAWKDLVPRWVVEQRVDIVAWPRARVSTAALFVRFFFETVHYLAFVLNPVIPWDFVITDIGVALQCLIVNVVDDVDPLRLVAFLASFLCLLLLGACALMGFGCGRTSNEVVFLPLAVVALSSLKCECVNGVAVMKASNELFCWTVDSAAITPLAVVFTVVVYPLVALMPFFIIPLIAPTPIRALHPLPQFVETHLKMMIAAAIVFGSDNRFLYSGLCIGIMALHCAHLQRFPTSRFIMVNCIRLGLAALLFVLAWIGLLSCVLKNDESYLVFVLSVLAVFTALPITMVYYIAFPIKPDYRLSTPQFKWDGLLWSQKGQGHELEHYHGHRLILFFVDDIKKDLDSKEVLEFSLICNLLARMRINLLGVARNSVNELGFFTRDHPIDFEIISDANDSLRKVNGIGMPGGLNSRVTFLIDKFGYVESRVNVFFAIDEHIKFAKLAPLFSPGRLSPVWGDWNVVSSGEEMGAPSTSPYCIIESHEHPANFCSLPSPLLNVLDEGGYTPLLTAVALGRVDVVENLVERGASPSIPSACERMNALAVAVHPSSKSSTAMVEALLRMGVSCNSQDRSGYSPAHLLLASEAPANATLVTELLLVLLTSPTLDVGLPSPHGASLIERAEAVGLSRVVARLQERGCEERREVGGRGPSSVRSLLPPIVTGSSLGRERSGGFSTPSGTGVGREGPRTPQPLGSLPMPLVVSPSTEQSRGVTVVAFGDFAEMDDPVAIPRPFSRDSSPVALTNVTFPGTAKDNPVHVDLLSTSSEKAESRTSSPSSMSVRKMGSGSREGATSSSGDDGLDSSHDGKKRNAGPRGVRKGAFEGVRPSSGGAKGTLAAGQLMSISFGEGSSGPRRG